MATLGQDLANTIRNLEHIRDAQKPPNQEIIHQIDILYDRALDYAASEIDESTKRYNAAAKSMSAAAQASLDAINDLAQTAKTIELVARAIKTIANLIAAV